MPQIVQADLMTNCIPQIKFVYLVSLLCCNLIYFVFDENVKLA